MVFFGYFCQQYIADYRRNEERKSASCISCTGVDNSNTSPVHWRVDKWHRNTSLYLDEGCTTFSCHCRPCLDFIKSSLNLTPPMFNQVFARSKSRSWHNSHVVLIVALPKWARALSWWKVLFQWHHIGSQTLIYVESAHNPITFPLADPLEDDKSTFEA
jgi:hypothetical protein